MSSLFEALAGLAFAGIVAVVGAAKIKETKDQADALANRDGRDNPDLGDYQQIIEIKELDAKIKYFQQHGDSMSLEDLEYERDNYEEQLLSNSEMASSEDDYIRDIAREKVNKCKAIVKILDEKIRRYGR